MICRSSALQGRDGCWPRGERVQVTASRVGVRDLGVGWC